MIVESITGSVILNTFLPKESKIAVKEATIIPNWFNLKTLNRITIYRGDTRDPNPTIVAYKEGLYSLADFKSQTIAHSQQKLWIDLTTAGDLHFKIADGYIVNIKDELKALLGLPRSLPSLKGSVSYYGRHLFNQLDHATLHLTGIKRDIFEINDIRIDSTTFIWAPLKNFPPLQFS